MGLERATVIGSGPNGLTAAIVLAQAGCEVRVFEAQPTLGGGVRSAPLTLPGFVHDICSAVHPLAVASPAFADLPLGAHGLRWIQPPLALAHPLDDGSVAVLARSLDDTCAALGRDGAAWRQVAAPLVEAWPELIAAVLGPPRIPRRASTALALAHMARHGLPPAMHAARRFHTDSARALFAGLAAHAILPLEMAGTAAVGWLLGVAAHAAGWPFPQGGAQAIGDALAGVLREWGGAIVTAQPVRSLSEIGADDRAPVLCDLTPRQFLEIAGHLLPAGYRRELTRWKYGPGVFKLDYALSEPIPWRAAACRQAGTVHLGGGLEEIAASERAAWRGDWKGGWNGDWNGESNGAMSERPFVLLAQPSLFDPSRAPAGGHTAWAYCHVPHGWSGDATAAIEAQIERFAPGFRDCVLARHAAGPAMLEARNANLVGGDIAGGAQTLRQLVLRPSWRRHATPLAGVYLCSAATPPGAGVHGMCGWQAAQRALRARVPSS